MHDTPDPVGAPTSQMDTARTFTLPTDSFECPGCGRTVVPTGDHLPDLKVEHECPAPVGQDT